MAFVTQPGRKPAQAIATEVYSVLDGMPTILEMANVAYPQEYGGTTLAALPGRPSGAVGHADPVRLVQAGRIAEILPGV